MRLSSPPTLFGRAVRRIHCVGVGGMGVGPLAIYLTQLGFEVTGEDDALTDDMRAILKREGVAVREIPVDAELVAYSSAIAKNHPAYLAAVARGLPLVRRGELLAEVVRDRKLVAVCGSHGKTTTTAMLITALRAANFPAGYVLGGLFADDTPPARTGSSDWVVAEIDESDGTIERFSPEITVTVNLDWDHPDFYRQAADLETTFAALFSRTRGAVLISDMCAMSGRVAQKSGATVQTFGRSGEFAAEVTGEAGEHTTLRLGGRFEIASATVRARGEFNAANAVAALAAVQLIDAEIRPTLLGDYPGVRRRQAILLEASGVTAIEDYAHHPAEIRALLGSLRRRVGSEGRLRVVFQPHRFSRTAQFKTEFAAALALADDVHLLDVYSAGEAPIAGGTTADIYAELKRNASSIAVRYVPGNDSAFARTLLADVHSGDWVVFVGAGDIERKAREWIALFKAEQTKGRRWDEAFAVCKQRVSPATRLRREQSLAGKTTIRIGGAARIYAEPADVADLQALLAVAREGGIEIFVLGRGSNLIVPDEGVDGLVISLAHESWATFEPQADGRVLVGAGLRLKNLCGLAAKAGLVGFEFLEGIPGNIGGALRMNAGAMGGWMFDVVDAVRVVTLAGVVKTLAKASMHIEYRHCAELHDAIAIGALLVPRKAGDESSGERVTVAADEITRQIDVYRKKRHETQPREPSAGCIFKNLPGSSAGRLIDECGLKGERVGDAEVSPVHANFIVNRGNATGADVLELVRRVRARVRQVKGVELQPEVLLYGKRWEDVL
jgi:UDP-N-acetylmuramate--alanine ligase